MPKVPRESGEVKVESRNILLVLSQSEGIQALADHFCGRVIPLGCPTNLPPFAKATVYLTGDLSKTRGLDEHLGAADQVFSVRELCCGESKFKMVGEGRVPIDFYGVGVYFREFFDRDTNFFEQVNEEHAFQSLTESNKPGVALRTGIYLTPVEVKNDETHFRLLRCSSNLSGPSDNFRRTDHRIVDALNHEATRIFTDPAPLNHVLAQVYENHPAFKSKKQTKAKIKAHADKTKDMPRDGIMAFCTFYDKLHWLEPFEKFDYGQRGITGLTRLHFRLKKCVEERPGNTYEREFSVTLYPNSAFFIPLSTNRLYTHEIRPSTLDAHLLPTRLGYVVRCSKSKAVHVNGATYLDEAGQRQKLKPATPADMSELRDRYYEENRSDAFIKYGTVLFSMNLGDYRKPMA